MTAITTGGSGNWSSTINNAPWAGGVVPVEGDSVIIASGHTVTLNQNAIVGSDPGFGGTAALAITGVLTFDNAASRSLTFKGDLKFNSGGAMTIGSSGTRYNSSYVATLIMNYSASMASGKYGIRVDYSTSSVFKCYGMEKTNNTYLTGSAASGQKVINVNDVTGWAAGDVVEIAGINAAGPGSTNAEENTIVSIATKAVTLTNNLAVTHPANSYVINTTKNIILKSYNTTNGWFADTRFGTIANFVLDNVAVQTPGGPSTAITGCIGFAINGNTSGELSTGNLQNVVFYKQAGVTASGGALYLRGPYGTGATINQCSFFGGSTSATGIMCSNGYLNPTTSNCIFMKNATGIATSAGAGAANLALSNCWFNGNNPALGFDNVANWTMSNNKFDGNQVSINAATGFVQTELNDTGSTYGTISANASILKNPGSYWVWVGSNNILGSSEVIWNTSSAGQNYIFPGSSLSLFNLTEGATAAIFRRYIATGTFTKDLAVQKNSVSSIRLDATFTGTSTYSFTFLAKTGITYTLLANMRYNSTYDDAAYTLPSITISGLGITPVVATATTAALSAWEAFTINVTQSSGADGLLTITLSGQSATATGSAYFDGIVAPPFITAARFYGYKFDETIPTRTVNAYVSASEATALAYTGIAIDWTAKTLVITTAHTMQEIYDYCQAQMSAAANLTKSEFLSTTDGLNYTLIADWDFTVTNVAVTATGQHLYMSATGVWSVTGASGDFTGIFTDATQTRVKINTTGIVAGSRIQLYDVDATTELANEIVAGTTHSIAFTHTADHDIRIRLTLTSGAATCYYWYTATNTVTNTGLTFAAAQESNAIYINNGIDGSTVTEASVSGATIRIYVDDPDNTTTAQRIYNWYYYYLFSEAGIREQDGDYVTATDSTHIVLANTMKIINQDTVNPLNLTGANITPVSGAATNIFDLTNGASICLNFNRVEGLSLNTTVADIKNIVDDNQALIISM